MEERDKRLAEQLSELKSSVFWDVLIELKNRVAVDTYRTMYLPVDANTILWREPELGQILAARYCPLLGVEKFLQLIENYADSYRKFVSESKKGEAL